MATYYFAIAFDTNTATDPQNDGTHLDAQYGFGLDTGSGVQAIGSGSGSSGRQFEAVQVAANSNGNRNQFAVAVFSNLIGVATQSSYLRLAFRPAHDVTPANNLPNAPLLNNDAQTLLNGVLLSAANSVPVNVNNGTNYGLPNSFYSTAWLFNGYNFTPGQAGSSVHFELTAELTIYNGTSYYFKVDPEMMIDF